MTASALNQSVAAAPTASRTRRVAFRVLISLLCLAFALTGGHLLIVGWFTGGIRRFDEVGWGVIEGVVILFGLVPQLRQPQRRVSGMRQTMLGLLAGLIAMPLTGIGDPATVVALVLFAAAVWLHPNRAAVLRRPRAVDPVLGVLAVIAAVPLIGWLAVIVHTAHTAAADNVHVTNQDYAGLAGLALGLALTAGLAAADRALLPAFCFGFGLVALAVASLVLPGQDDAWASPAAVVAVVAGLVFIALALSRRRGAVER